MEFLKREGLYSPQMKDMRVDDPVATDLIGALLTVGPFGGSFNRIDTNFIYMIFVLLFWGAARTIEYDFITTQLQRFGGAIDQSAKFHFVADETEGQFNYQQFATKLPRLELRYIPFGADNRTTSISLSGHGTVSSL